MALSSNFRLTFRKIKNETACKQLGFVRALEAIFNFISFPQSRMGLVHFYRPIGFSGKSEYPPKKKLFKIILYITFQIDIQALKKTFKMIENIPRNGAENYHGIVQQPQSNQLTILVPVHPPWLLKNKDISYEFFRIQVFNGTITIEKLPSRKEYHVTFN